MEEITIDLDLKESLGMPVHRVSPVEMEESVLLEILAGGDPTAEEEPLGPRELLVEPVRKESLESLVLQDLEDHRGQTDPQDSRVKKETPGQEGLEGALEQPERKADEELSVARESPEIQDRKASKAQWVQ